MLLTIASPWKTCFGNSNSDPARFPMPESCDFPDDVFLSQSAKDKQAVRPLAERLRKDGLKVWFDEWEIKPGDSIPAKIEEGLEHSRVLVLCMSANAFGSDWAQLEAGTFRFRDPLNKERRFIPLRLDDTPIKGSLAQFLYIDCRPADREHEYSKLLVVCRPPATAPPTALPSAENALRHTGDATSSPSSGTRDYLQRGRDTEGVLARTSDASEVASPSTRPGQKSDPGSNVTASQGNPNRRLTRLEINKVVNRYIGVDGGYLGDFSYQKHHDFYLDLDLDIDPYKYEGTTRERFIKIISESPPNVQAKILEGILDRFPAGSSELRTEERRDEIADWIVRLRA
ncbi:MAG: toll/interleukin-1 receptor domain-containing protein [Verrucomicrobiales bacterium]|nr:toll/interleukin-1 receptor domain-containing protein [Verrucomicrobiales bacterium]